MEFSVDNGSTWLLVSDILMTRADIGMDTDVVYVRTAATFENAASHIRIISLDLFDQNEFAPAYDIGYAEEITSNYVIVDVEADENENNYDSTEADVNGEGDDSTETKGDEDTIDNENDIPDDMPNDNDENNTTGGTPEDNDENDTIDDTPSDDYESNTPGDKAEDSDENDTTDDSPSGNYENNNSPDMEYADSEEENANSPTYEEDIINFAKTWVDNGSM
jgi:hypothetical protein